MYDELAKRLREAAISADSGNEISESLYRDIMQAADAIEVLLKHVPKRPHGRLGDLDELEKSFREDADAEWNRFAAPVNWADAFDDVANIVADAPTVIEAEEQSGNFGELED